MANEEPSKDYEYGERRVPDMRARELSPGAGRISGALSVTLGLMSLLGVLCFRFPSLLTTDELRTHYDLRLLRELLEGTMLFALGFASFTFLRNKNKREGAVGVLATLLGLALGGWWVEVGPVHDELPSLGLDWLLLDLLGSGALFIFIEKVLPRYPDQVIFRPEWRLDLTSFAINHLVVGALLLIGNRFAPLAFAWAVNAKVQAAVQGLPVAAQIVLLAFCADFVQYWIHRAYHEVPWLWRLHAVHHSAEHMDWLAGSRNHTLQILLDRTLAMVPLYLIGPSAHALDIYVVLAAFQTVFAHANVGLPTGPLKWLLVTPQFHHWHHASDKPAIDTNYAVHFPLFDKLFGTFHLPEAHWPIQYGTVTRLPRTLLAQLRYPFEGVGSKAA